jgi:hypothetical protein
MEDIVTQRVNEFREVNKLSVTSLSKVLNIGQTTLNKQLKEDGYGVSLSTILLLLSAYPELSAEWLLRGEGEMKKGDEWKVTQFIPVPNNELVDALKDHIASLKAENEHLRKEIDEYRREKSGAAAGYGYMAAEGTPLTKTE